MSIKEETTNQKLSKEEKKQLKNELKLEYKMGKVPFHQKTIIEKMLFITKWIISVFALLSFVLSIILNTFVLTEKPMFLLKIFVITELVSISFLLFSIFFMLLPLIAIAEIMLKDVIKVEKSKLTSNPNSLNELMYKSSLPKNFIDERPIKIIDENGKLPKAAFSSVSPEAGWLSSSLVEENFQKTIEIEQLKKQLRDLEIAKINEVLNTDTLLSTQTSNINDDQKQENKDETKKEKIFLGKNANPTKTEPVTTNDEPNELLKERENSMNKPKGFMASDLKSSKKNNFNSNKKSKQKFNKNKENDSKLPPSATDELY